MAAEKKQVQVQLDLPSDLEAIYSNLAVISHTPSEIFVDLACLLPNLPKAKVHTRVVMTPLNAKLLQQALAENLRKYEAQFGEIQLPPGGIGASLVGGNGPLTP
jgi:hypothetical protein